MSIFTDEKGLKASLVEVERGDPAYPAAWRELPDAPERLYALGDISLLHKRNLAVVGSRRTPTNALKLGREIIKELSQKLVIVTGVSDGGDSAALEGALSGSGRVICLLAGGFSALPQTCLALLERVAAIGVIVAVHSFETPIRVYSYEYRNKLLAKLADGVFVLGAGEKSGALITARYAKGYGKRIYAFPYPPNSTSGCGCNQLIKAGAALVEGARDIAQGYGIEWKESGREVKLTAEEAQVYAALCDLLEAHANELAAKAGIAVYKIRAVLSSLEVKGVITAIGGNRYAIV